MFTVLFTRTIGDATMDIIRGELTTPMCLMEIKVGNPVI